MISTRETVSLQEIQQAELQILHEVLKVFKKYNLKHYAVDGTLLGAIRHKGFIPWDDDIDIGLPRPDYEKFLQIAESELKHPFYLHTFQNKRRQTGLYFTQVADESFVFKRKYGGKIVDTFAWIDIFPLDGVPERDISFKFWRTKCLLLTKMFSLSQIGNVYDIHGEKNQWKTKKEKFIKIFLKLRLNKLLNSGRLWKSLDKSMKKYDYQYASRIIHFCSPWRKRELFKKAVYEKANDYQFEDVTLRGPQNYDFVLTQIYGDYMTPPKEACMNSHDIICG